MPVRFPPETISAVRQRAEEDDRSVSSWIRRAVERELRHLGLQCVEIRGGLWNAYARFELADG